MRVATLAALISSSAAAPNLHVAAYKDDVNVIQDQLRLGVDVNLKSEEGDRALHVAVAKGSVNAVAALLEAGAGPVDEVIEEDGRTLLDFARDKANEGRQHKKVLPPSGSAGATPCATACTAARAPARAGSPPRCGSASCTSA